MSFSESRSSSSRASWMFTDPYTYQYSDIGPEDNIPDDSPVPQGVAAGSDLCELEGSAPTDTTRYELAANSLIENIRDNHPIPNEPGSPCGLSRNRLSNARGSLKYPGRRGSTRDRSFHITPEPYTPRSCPPQPPNSGLIPVLEDSPTPAHHFAQDTAPIRCARPSPPGYAEGLIPVDDNAATPKEPSSDFDAILRNIGPIPKNGKGKTGRERSSRYYDRYSSNFG
ncbi:hypothetical protein EKO27_g9781 [Xylaria grammica]|uniref:Uncharacterized protein n=1 Tax=Xylaria grammica TaxID=363999 RepID=A0A439CT62_9PEZI|nr:hypothetical protein EKO27_g9781 [Xylaria grammica]